MNDLFGLVSVRPPYCALQDVRLGDGCIEAAVRRSHPMQRERGPIAAAEVGRHLAIAGAAAAATRNPAAGKHFYLARRARIERLWDDATPVSAEPFHVDARSDGVLKRHARAFCTLRRGNAELYRLEVEYDVISTAFYTRMVRGLPEVSLEGVADREVFDEPMKLTSTGDGATLTELRVAPEICLGHFPEYPAFPVAKLMHLLSYLGGEHLAHRLGRPDLQYVVERAEVSAEQLAFAGSVVSLTARYSGQEADNSHRIACEARLGDGLCGAMDLYLSER